MSTSENSQSSCEKSKTPLFFFLGALVVLVTLLILIFVIRKVLKTEWMAKFVLQSGNHQGYTYDIFKSDNSIKI